MGRGGRGGAMAIEGMVTRCALVGYGQLLVRLFPRLLRRVFRQRVDILGGAPLTWRASRPLAPNSPDAHADHAAAPRRAGGYGPSPPARSPRGIPCPRRRAT